MKTKQQKLITQLKINSIKLRLNYQIPLKLAVFINNIDDHTSVKEVEFLMELSKHYIRVKNYYKMYKNLDDTYSYDIVLAYNKFKGQVS